MFLFSSDWHLDSKPKNAYRWEIIPWLKRHAQLRGAKAIFILGDIADAKDHHTNEFVNRVVEALRDLSVACPIYMLPGNHDASNPEYPLLKFLQTDPLIYHSEPWSGELFGYKFLFLPNQKTQIALTSLLKKHDGDSHDFVLMHQTFRGSITSNGFPLQGFDFNIAGEKAKYISGDVHVPQTIGNITYCGSPHPINFGDDFKPRVLFWDGKVLKSIPRTTLKKAVLYVSSIEELEKVESVTEGDQVKVILSLPRAEFGKWEDSRLKIEKLAADKGLILSGMELKESGASTGIRGSPPKVTASPAAVLAQFCISNTISKDLEEFGKKLIS